MHRRSIGSRSRRGLIGLRSLITSLIAFAAVAFVYREAVKRVVNRAIAESSKAPFDIQSEISGPLQFNNFNKFDVNAITRLQMGQRTSWRAR